MNYLSFLDPIFDRVHSMLSEQIEDLAAQLQVPYVWLLQFLNSNVQAEAVNPRSVTKIANGLVQHMMLSRCFPEWNTSEIAQFMPGCESYASTGGLVSQLPDFSGKLNNYYDLFSALSIPEMIGKPDDWASPTSSSAPLTKAAFKKYIRSTVPKENHRLIFGEVA